MHGVAIKQRQVIGTATRPPAPPPAPVRLAPVAVPESHRYGDRAGPNWVAIATILLGHVLLLVALVKMDVIPLARKPAPPLAVNLITLAPPPPPRPSDPEPEPRPVPPSAAPRVIAPPPIVESPAPPPPVAVAPAPPPPQAVVVSAAPKSVVAAAPVAVDLSARMVSAKPPRYPTESLRKREQGTVVLRLLLGLDGAVDEIAVARSSGFERLDKAALDAVRRWRWSPMVQGGETVQVRGVVEIPFVLKA